LSANTVCRQNADYVCGLLANIVSRPDILLISKFKTPFCVDEVCASCKFLLNERRRQINRTGDSLLEDLKLENGAGFRKFGRITSIDFEAATYYMLQNIKLHCIVVWPYFEHLPRR
jgi:hypothetical protein